MSMLLQKFTQKQCSTGLNKSRPGIGIQLDNIGTRAIKENREYVKVLIEVVLYCAQQGIAFRGYSEDNEASNPGNFRSMINLMSRHIPAVERRLKESSKTACWLSLSM